MYRGIKTMLVSYLLFIIFGLCVTHCFAGDFKLKDQSESLWLTTIVTDDAIWIKIKPSLKPFGALLKKDPPKETRLCSAYVCPKLIAKPFTYAD